MPVTKEIARKCQEYDKAQMAADRLFEELYDFFTSYDDENENVTLTGFGTCPSDQVKGDEQQFDGEYCDQTQRGEDSYEGTYYIPVEGSNEFVYFKYTC